MSEEKNAIQKLYEDPKSKGFINHLIMSYLPIYKTEKVFNFSDKNPHKCNVCQHDLIDVQTVFDKSRDTDYMKDSIHEMAESIQGKEIPYEEKAIIKHVTHGAILAWTGEKTTTFLCMECVKNLLEMVTNGLMTDDKNIIWITNKMKRDQLFSSFKENPALNKEEVKKVDEIHKRVDRKKVATFGDLEVLQNLKAKMEAGNS